MPLNVGKHSKAGIIEKFGYQDLSPRVQAMVPDGADIFTLTKNTWIRVGGFWIFCEGVPTNIDHVWVDLKVYPHRLFLNSAVLQRKQNSVETQSVRWCTGIPGTNIIIDVFFRGDGTEGIALAVLPE